MNGRDRAGHSEGVSLSTEPRSERRTRRHSFYTNFNAEGGFTGMDVCVKSIKNKEQNNINTTVNM